MSLLVGAYMPSKLLFQWFHTSLFLSERAVNKFSSHRKVLKRERETSARSSHVQTTVGNDKLPDNAGSEASGSVLAT